MNFNVQTSAASTKIWIAFKIMDFFDLTPRRMSKTRKIGSYIQILFITFYQMMLQKYEWIGIFCDTGIIFILPRVYGTKNASFLKC